MKRRVVITGVGCVTPLAREVETYWRGLLNGQSSVRPITLFDASQFPVRIASEVEHWVPPETGAEFVDWEDHPRQTQFAVAAALEAHRSAKLNEAPADPRRFGIYVGCGEVFQDFDEFIDSVESALTADGLDTGIFMQSALRNWNSATLANRLLNVPAAMLAGLFGSEGPATNCVTACATSCQAIGEAARTIQRNDTDLMLCGGAHSMIHPFGISGFLRLGALSTRNDEPTQASSPFDLRRDGFVIGEGSAMFVLEELQHARKRGVEILCELTGYGNAQDACQLTDPHPEGRGAAHCMRLALADAGLRPDEIDYINAHGTSTKANDRIETMAIKSAFGNHARQVPISSTKSMIGHLVTASGAVELVACIMSLRDGVVHPTINYREPDPDCDLDYVPSQSREISCRHVMSNSFGFGGQNASLIVSRLN